MSTPLWIALISTVAGPLLAAAIPLLFGRKPAAPTTPPAGPLPLPPGSVVPTGTPMVTVTPVPGSVSVTPVAAAPATAPSATAHPILDNLLKAGELVLSQQGGAGLQTLIAQVLGGIAATGTPSTSTTPTTAASIAAAAGPVLVQLEPEILAGLKLLAQNAAAQPAAA
jgi:hypothetical protein